MSGSLFERVTSGFLLVWPSPCRTMALGGLVRARESDTGYVFSRFFGVLFGDSSWPEVDCRVCWYEVVMICVTFPSPLLTIREQLRRPVFLVKKGSARPGCRMRLHTGWCSRKRIWNASDASWSNHRQSNVAGQTWRRVSIVGSRNNGFNPWKFKTFSITLSSSRLLRTS